MMMNLFSIFDPSTSMTLSLNWISSLMVMLFIPLSYWFCYNRYMYVYMYMLNFLSSEMKLLLLKKMNYMNLIIYISIFYMCLLNNFMGLFPYIFTSSSHLSMSLLISLSLWISFMLYGWLKNLNHMFSHLVPLGTPFVLMPFMVLIETISNIIRPGTLAVRLSANMIAGHLLMTLISSTGPSLSSMMLLVMLLSQMLLMILELSVSVIQAYVISILSLLYSTELN